MVLLSLACYPLITTLMRQFLKPTVVDGKIVKDLIDVDFKDSVNQLQLLKMDFELEVKIQVID